MKIYAKDVRENDAVTSVFLVTRKTTAEPRNSKPFLALTLRDKTGELDARIWENVEVFGPLFNKGDLVEVRGHAQSFQGRVQLKIDELTKADAATQDPEDFPPPPAAEKRDDRFVGPILELLERLRDPHLKALVKTFTDDEAFLAKLRRAPAAKSVHHARHGGLAEHTLSVMRLAHRMADHYPMVDRDLMVAGAFLHDVCKLEELRYDRQTEYTDEGRLVGHLVMGAQLLREKTLKLEGFPKALEMHLTHIILAHHGRLDHGSPRLPMTLEAMLVHTIDELDSRMAGWLEIMQRDPGETWTDYQKLYDRHLFKGAPPTQNARPPVERRKKQPKPEVSVKPQAGAAPQPAPKAEGEGAPREQEPERKPRRERPERPERAERAERPERPERPERETGPRGAKAEVKLTFKPFAALTPTPPAEMAEAAAGPETPEAPEALEAEQVTATPTPEAEQEGAATSAQAVEETTPQTERTGETPA